MDLHEVLAVVISESGECAKTAPAAGSPVSSPKAPVSGTAPAAAAGLPSCIGNLFAAGSLSRSLALSSAFSNGPPGETSSGELMGTSVPTTHVIRDFAPKLARHSSIGISRGLADYLVEPGFFPVKGPDSKLELETQLSNSD